MCYLIEQCDDCSQMRHVFVFPGLVARNDAARETIQQEIIEMGKELLEVVV